MSAKSPFDDPAIQRRIRVKLARIEARWLEEDAQPTDGDFDTKIAQTLVERLDAHAQPYLTVVDNQDLLNPYEARLRVVGKALITNATQRSLLADPYSEDRLRRIAESSGDFIRRRASGIARLSVESSGSRVTHFTTPSCVLQPRT